MSTFKEDLKEKVEEIWDESFGYSAWASIGGCIIVLCFLVLIYLALGLIFILAWNYVVPVFWTNAPSLSIWHGVGVVILLQFIKSLFTKITS